LNNDKLVKAYSLSVNVRHFIHHQINYFSFEVPVNDMDGFAQRIIDKISYAATAYNYFLELNIYKEAYQSLCDMIEIIELATQAYHITPPHDKNELYEVKKQMESQLEISPYQLFFLSSSVKEMMKSSNLVKQECPYLKISLMNNWKVLREQAYFPLACLKKD
jgi:hypothetical protein